MKKAFVVAIVICLLPNLTNAVVCNQDGYTVVFVNGILNDLEKATDSSQQLQRKLGKLLNSENVEVRVGHNPSHLAGVGDLVHSVAQAFNKPISKFDLDTILMEIHPQVTTRKVLLVGHSQGTFYTNEMYEYLTSHGVPKESIAVYNIATPASFVAGGGGYVTSGNDKIINLIRDMEIAGNVRINTDSFGTIGSVVSSALRANISIPREDGYDSNTFGGHSFSLYLDGATSRIMSDINGVLKNLRSSGSSSLENGCFIPPVDDIAFKAKKTLFAVADPIAGSLSSAAKSATSFVSGVFKSLSAGIDAAQEKIPYPTNPLVASQVSAAAAATEDPHSEPQEETSLSQMRVSVTRQQNEVQTIRTENIGPPAQTPPVPPAPKVIASPPVVPLINITPGFGGGGAPSQEINTQSQSSNSNTQSSSAVVPFSVNFPAEGAIFATSSIRFSGTTTAGYVVISDNSSVVSTTTADAVGNWSVDLSLIEGTHQVAFSSNDGAGNFSATTTRSVIVDLTPPGTSTLSVEECDYSLAAAFCLIPTLNATVSWSTAVDSVSYGLFRDDILIATTTANTYISALVDTATTTFSVVSYDAAGNSAASSPIAVRTSARPLVINEIGWGVDASVAANQFIEIKNISPYTLDLSHLSMVRSGGNTIALSGTLGPVSGAATAGYMVLEQMDFISLGINELITPFDSLLSSGEQITLMWNTGSGSTALDATPPVGTCSGWCAGSASEKIGTSVQSVPDTFLPLSMERNADASDGLLPTSWHTTDSYGPYLGNNNMTWGSPGIANSAGRPEAGWFCGTDEVIGETAPPGSTYIPGGTNCTFLSRFISILADRVGTLFKGDIGNSTGVSGDLFGKALASTRAHSIIDPQIGDHFFVAIWEVRAGASFNDTPDFGNYFQTGSPLPPHGNYVVIPWIYGQ